MSGHARAKISITRMSKMHRFLVGEHIKLKQDFWLHDPAMLWQWNKVLRFREGQEVILFDGLMTDRLYKIEKITKSEAHLVMTTELQRKMPIRHAYLFWSLLKKDNNEFILQKATELGIANFVPLITSRTIKKDFNIERARKIVVEASEQCGRSDIPHVREPVHLEKALEEYSGKLKMYICHQGESSRDITDEKVGMLIGPEGGWSDQEQQLFKDLNYEYLALSEFTLRAETAAIIASSKALSN